MGANAPIFVYIFGRTLRPLSLTFSVGLAVRAAAAARRTSNAKSETNLAGGSRKKPAASDFDMENSMHL